MHRRTWRFICLLIVGACADDPIAPAPDPDGPLTLTMSIEPDTIAPGHESVISITAALPADQRLTMIQLRFSGLGPPDTFDLPILGDGTHAYRIILTIERLPIEAQLHFQVVAHVETVRDSIERVLTIADDGPPVMVITAVRAVEPPDSLEFSYQGSDGSELDSFFVRVFDAAGAQIDSVVIRQQAPFIFGSRNVWVPAATQLGDSVVVQGTAFDLFGKATSARQVVPVTDTTPPVLSVHVDTLAHPFADSTYPSLLFLPGDTIRFRIRGADQYSLRSLGYRWLHLSDSVTPARREDSAQFAIVVPPGTNTPYATLALWATDSTGNQAAQNAFTSVMDGILRPIEALYPAGAFNWPGGGVLDTKRQRYYVAADNYVHAIGLNPVGRLPPIAFGSAVRSVDLSPSGDSLVALLNTQPPRLLTWDIDVGTTVIDTTVVTLLCCGAWDMQVAANGHVLVTGFDVVDVSPASGAQRVRSATAGQAMNLISSTDRRYVVQWDDLRAAVYQSDLDSLAPLKQLFPDPPPAMPIGNAGPYVSPNGAVLNRNRLYDVSLSAFQQIQPDPGQFPQAQALSHDGQWAYIGNWPGYWKVNALTGAVVEKVILPRVPVQLIPHPDGQRLIVLSGSWVGVVNLQ